jgi:hypothetical protein
VQAQQLRVHDGTANARPRAAREPDVGVQLALHDGTLHPVDGAHVLVVAQDQEVDDLERPFAVGFIGGFGVDLEDFGEVNGTGFGGGEADG